MTLNGGLLQFSGPKFDLNEETPDFEQVQIKTGGCVADFFLRRRRASSAKPRISLLSAAAVTVSLISGGRTRRRSGQWAAAAPCIARWYVRSRWHEATCAPGPNLRDVLSFQDGGKTFKFDNSADDIPGNLYSVKFNSDGTGFALGSDGALLRYTGGKA